MKLKFLLFLVAILCASCDGRESEPPAMPPDLDQLADSQQILELSMGPPAALPDLDELANSYLFLELSMGLHDPAHVDAYFGPEELQTAAAEKQLGLDNIDSLAEEMIAVLLVGLQSGSSPRDTRRMEGLLHRLGALQTRIALREGRELSFDDESRALFGTAAPDNDAAHFDAILDQIDSLLPGDAPLSERVNNFQDQFVIPGDRLGDVFDAAIAECRRRTLEYIDLPEHESFTLEYVNDKPWSGYNWYQGDAQSLIQINTDLPIYITRAVDLGCHEGYPGHHTFNALVEKHLVEDNGWIEYSLYPLFSPQSLIAEGSGNYGIELAFPGPERLEFERDVLFPLAGLDAAEADRYYQLQSLLAQLSYAGNEAARDYLNGTIDRQQAIDWLVRYSLSSPERAKQRTEFIDTYRSYVINYNLGKDLVQHYVELDAPQQDARWARFEALLSSPVHPTELE